jgi:hypothetical protein
MAISNAAPLAEYAISASYGAPAAGSSIPKGLFPKQLVRLLAQTLSSGIDFRIKMKILATAWA